MKKIVVFLLSVLTSYLVFSFLAWDINARNWWFGWRVMALVLSLFIADYFEEGGIMAYKLLLSLMSFSIGYILMSFFLWEISPALWTEGQRLVSIILPLPIAAIWEK